MAAWSAGHDGVLEDIVGWHRQDRQKSSSGLDSAGSSV